MFSCCPSPLEGFSTWPHAALCCPSHKKCLLMMFLPLRMVPFLKILKTVFLYSFWGVAARKHKNQVCTDLIRHFGTSFELVLSWGKKSSRGLRIFPLKHCVLSSHS